MQDKKIKRLNSTDFDRLRSMTYKSRQLRFQPRSGVSLDGMTLQRQKTAARTAQITVPDHAEVRPQFVKPSSVVANLPVKRDMPAMPVHTKLLKSSVIRRDSFKPRQKTPIAKTNIKNSKQSRHSKTSVALLSAAAFLFLTGMIISFSTIKNNNKLSNQVSALAQKSQSNTSTDPDGVPSEADPPKNSVKSYHVSPDLPRVIRIPNIAIEARVVRLGTGPSNQLRAPSSIFDAGWYDGSSKPGEPGAVLIDGHVSGPTKHGIFYNLKNLNPGDDIQIEKGDNKIIHYKVVKIVSYPVNEVDMAAALTPVIPGKNGLNIMTCSGKFDVKSNEYLQRIVVFASEQ